MDYSERVSQISIGEIVTAWILAAIALLGLICAEWVTGVPQEPPTAVDSQASPGGADTETWGLVGASEPDPSAVGGQSAAALFPRVPIKPVGGRHIQVH